MDREEALKQISEIQNVLQSSHTLPISIVQCMALGLTIAVLPAIEIPTHYLFMGTEKGPAPTITSGVVHAAVYLALFSLIVFIAGKVFGGKTEPSHPLLKKALTFHRPFAVSVMGTMIMFIPAGLDRFIYPVSMMLFGMLINTYGQFSIRILRALGWSYVILGIAFGLMLKEERIDLWVYFNTYVGLSLVVAGATLRKTR